MSYLFFARLHEPSHKFSNFTQFNSAFSVLFSMHAISVSHASTKAPSLSAPTPSIPLPQPTSKTLSSYFTYLAIALSDEAVVG